ncbi:MAG: hypothetical protein Q8S73_22110 [Deltaproteobacteria bacterium]|nr:hypothetical protein [Myxococcales bacterium]MDP3216820.1 hypothetical protein [Deltaproteobacteria bacterium]
MRPLASTALLLALLPACPRRSDPPRPPPDVGPSSRPVSIDDPRDAAVDVPVAAADVPADRPAVVIRGPWQRLPLARWTDPARLGRWDDAPDVDGDERPDEVFAMDARLVTCEAAHRDIPCPAADDDDGGGDADDGPARVALIARFSADVAPSPTTGRLFGLQRVWRSRSMPTSRIDAVRFGDFGRGVSVRTTLLVDHGAGRRDTVDRVDLYLGAGLDRPAGTVVHHCLRSLDGPLERDGAIAVTLPAETPTLWRFASAHPFSACETDAVALDAALGRTLARGVRVLELRSSAIETHRALRLAVVEGRARVIESGPRGSDAGFEGDPLALGAVRVLAVARRCDYDLVRYQHESKSCLVRVARPRGEARCDPTLRPVASFDDAHPVALVPGADPTMPALVLHRAGALVSVQLPARCGVGHHTVDALPFRGAIPPGTPVSTDGSLVLFDEGRDLWLARVGDPRPALVNVPGEALPRGTLRAVAFIDARQVAVVIARSLFEFTLDVPAPMDSVPETLRVGAAELHRALRTTR